MKKVLSSLALAAAALTSLSAQAVTVTFGGQVATDNSGLTSNYVPANNQLTFGVGGFFIETFDPATAMAGSPFPPLTSADPAPAGINIAQGCSFNSYNALGVGVTGGFAVMQGSIPNQAAAPANDDTCYGVSPQPGSVDDNGNPVTNGSVLISYAGLLTGTDYINYLGLYYGSIDTYNDLYFYSTDDGTGLPVAVVTGAYILGELGGQSGNQQGAGSNVYVNLDFTAAEGFRSFRFVTTGIAVEVDNIVVGLASRQVPEPASLALLGVGLAALGLSRRRKAAK